MDPEDWKKWRDDMLEQMRNKDQTWSLEALLMDKMLEKLDEVVESVDDIYSEVNPIREMVRLR